MTESLAGERFLVTGGTGCIGSWVVRTLVREGAPVTVLTSSGRLDRLRLILSDTELSAVRVVEADVADHEGLESLARDQRITRLIHLAALQLPFCAADPLAGARTNVVGTVGVFEAAKRLGIGPVVYASSAAVYGPAAQYGNGVVGDDAPLSPTSHYGVYKVANEGTARVYWQNDRVPSIGLRPHSAYGPGRDQGVTSKPTVAMIAAAAGRPYHVNYGGRYQFQFAGDVARAFVRAARAAGDGARVFNIGGPAFGVDEIVQAIEHVEPAAAGSITFGDTVLAFPGSFDGSAIRTALGPLDETPLLDGVRETISTYRAAIERGLVTRAELDRILA